MYESFFGLNEKPFSLLPDPSFFYLSRIHQEALTLVEYGLYNQTGFTVLTGEIGSGKTTLMRYLLDKLDDDLTVGLISHTHQSIGQIMDWVCVAFELRAPAGDKIQQHQALVDFLLDQYSRGKKTLLIIDEAQNLGLEKLEEIRLLSNINADKDLVLQLLLLGQPQLREQLRSPDLEQFVQRVSASYHLGRLTAEDTFYYIRHRLRIAGGHKAIFTPDACHAIYHYSKGVPRIINLICETALVFSYGARAKKITGEAIDEFVKNDASHLLFAINNEDRQSAPDYGTVFDDDSNLIPDEASETDQDDQKLAIDQDEDGTADLPEPSAPLEPIAAETTEPPPVGKPDRFATYPRKKGEPDDVSRDRDGATTALGATAGDQRVDKDPASLTDTAEDIEELSMAELIRPSGSARRWTGEAIAIAAGLLLGVGLVAWYLFQEDTEEGAPQTAGRTIEYPATRASEGVNGLTQDAATPPIPPSTSDDIERPPQLTAAPGDAADPFPPDGTSTAMTEDPVNPRDTPESIEASEPDTLVSAEAGETSDGDSKPSATSLDRLASRLEGLSLSVEHLGPSRVKADFSRLIRFDDGSTTLNTEAKRILGQFSSLVNEAGPVQIKVIAHTDSKGTEETNKVLSQQRAETVAAFMEKQGIDKARIQRVGKGEEELRIDAEQEKAQGPWINRRIEVELIEPE